MSAAAGPDSAITRDAVLFLAIRPTGYPAAFDRVLQDLETRKSLPEALTRLVGVEPPPAAENRGAHRLSDRPWSYRTESSR